MVKLHISNPATGRAKIVEIDSEQKLRDFYDKKISEEVKGDNLGDDFKGYVFKIVGGQDKEGFSMKQGVSTTARVQVLMPRGTAGFQKWRGRGGERRRKSIRGCIVSPDLGVIQLIIVQQGANPLPGLTTDALPRTFGPKRASKIRKLFSLSKEQDVRKYVIKHEETIGKKNGGKKLQRGPKIQRLVTSERLRRKKRHLKGKIEARTKRQADRKTFSELLKKRKSETERKEPAKKQKTETAPAKK